MKQRYFIEISYKGTHYHGWQVQPNALTVQAVFNERSSLILRQPVESLGCGRTDTGVHATQFFLHADLRIDSHVPLPSLINSLNSVLPPDIAVKRIIKVSPHAHARFDATLRSYQYHIHFHKDPFRQNLSWHLKDMPDVEAMNTAASILFMYTDFSSFSKTHTQVFTNNCRIEKAEWVLTKDGLAFHISADRFLRNMVRAIVGTLLMVGKHQIKPEELHAIIESKSRSNAGNSVPACGLYLTGVSYPYISA